MPTPTTARERPRSPAAGRKSTASFQEAITAQIAEGVAADTMVLHLTRRDAANLRRDPSVPLEAISFSDGEMRLLGVKVVTGGVEVSSLEIAEA